MIWSQRIKRPEFYLMQFSLLSSFFFIFIFTYTKSFFLICLYFNIPFLINLFVIFYLFLKVFNLNIVYFLSLARLSPEGPQASSLADSKRKNGKRPRDYIIEIKIYYTRKLWLRAEIENIEI